MKSFIVLAMFVAAALAAPAGPDADAVVVRQTLDNIGVDGYNFGYETSNGLAQQEEGSVQGTGEDQGIEVRGQFSYTGPDGVLYSVTYTAGRNGFEPQGAHIPKAA